MSTGLKPLHAALYQRLTGDSALMNKVTAVYDHVPANATLPYIVIEDSSKQPWGLLDDNASRVQLVLDVHSRQGGRKEIMEICDALHTLLHMQTFSMTGFSLELVEIMSIDALREDDGITTRARVRLRCYVREAA